MRQFKRRTGHAADFCKFLPEVGQRFRWGSGAGFSLARLFRFLAKIDQDDVIALNFAEIGIADEGNFFRRQASTFGGGRTLRSFPRGKSALEDFRRDAGFLIEGGGCFQSGIGAEASIVNDGEAERRELLLRGQSGGDVNRAGNVSLRESCIGPDIDQRQPFAGFNPAREFAGRDGKIRRGADQREAAKPGCC